MRRLGLLLIPGLAAGVGLAACQQEDVTLHKKVDDLAAKIDSIDKKVSAGAMRGAARPPQRRPGPDPTAVYAVPLDNAGSRGPATAKVTIVEAFDFA